MNNASGTPLSGGASGGGSALPETASRIIALERAALERWANGDPSGFLEICAPDVTYFDPSVPLRLDGLDALDAHYEKIRGQVQLDKWELLNPAVACHGDVAVLTFNYSSGAGTAGHRWNCTEIYRLQPGDAWKIVHTHWSLTAILPAPE